MERKPLFLLILTLVVISYIVYILVHKNVAEEIPNNTNNTNTNLNNPNVVSVDQNVDPKNASGCIRAGDVYQSPAALGKIRGECCGKIGTIAQMTANDCDVTGDSTLAGGNSICSDCGNTICESAWENRCNCPQDCKNTLCHEEGKFYSPMPLPDGSQDLRPCCNGLTEVGAKIATDTTFCINCGDNICKNYTFAGEIISEKTLCPSDCN